MNRFGIMTGTRSPLSGQAARILPQARLAGPMPWVIAIMIALTVMATAAGLALNNVAGNAKREISGGLTVQVVEGAPRERERQTAAAARYFAAREDVASIRRIPEAELNALLEPWLGSDIAANDAIPVPTMIDIRLTGSVERDRLRQMRAELSQIAPSARLDAQAGWLSPVFDAIRSLQLLAAGLAILLAAISTAAVWLSARSTLGANHETIEVIHHLGGSEGQIAGIFERAIGWDAALGGAAGLLLGLSAIFVLGNQFAALGSGLVAGGGLGPLDWALVGAVPLLGIVLAMLTARITVISSLRQMV